MPQILNKVTGKTFNASDADWNAGNVYNQKDESGANIWSLAPSGSSVSTTPATPTPINTVTSSQMQNVVNNNSVSQAKSSENGRLLGPTEYKNLVNEWATAGLTNQEIESNFLNRQGNNIYLKNNTPTSQNILQLRKNASQAPVSPTNLPQDNANSQSGNNVPETPKSALDLKMDMANNYKENIATERTEAQEAEGVPEIQAQMTDAQKLADESMAKIETMKTGLEANDIINEEAKIALKNKLEGQVIPMSEINKQLLVGSENLDQAQRLKRLYDVYEINTNVNVYNAQLRNVQLLQGQYQMAMENVQQSVDDWVTEQNLKMDILTEQGQLEKEERAKIESEINYERGLMMEGYVYVENTDTYNKLVKQFGVNAGNFSNFFYKDPANGKIYLKPGATLISSSGTVTSGSGKRVSGGGANVVSPAGQVSNLTQSIIDNPSLFDDLTPTNRGKVIEELQGAGYDTANLGTKGLSDTAIQSISQSEKALSDLAELRNIIAGNEQYIGPLSGWQKLNPWSKARQVQATIDRVKQTVGKALEGGVLRKEDEDKYKKILATMLDTPETALYKVNSIISSITKDIATYKSLQQSGGRSTDVTASLQKKNTNSNNDPLGIR
jgi:hypothetical protein